MSLISAAMQFAKQAPDGNASTGFVASAIDANGNPYVIDENGVQRYLDITAPSQADLTPSAAVSAALFSIANFALGAIHINAGAGSGAFTAAYSLPTTNMRDGAIVEVTIDLPASANPTITLGTGPLASVTNPAPAAVANWYGRFRYNATANAWHLLTRNWNI